MVRPNPDFTNLTIDLTVWDLKHLTAIIGELREKAIISRVDRVVA
jgi:GTP pyrophosphokinase